MPKKRKFTSVEICAGAGGQAIGLENAGFEHLALVEIEEIACQRLRDNRPRTATSPSPAPPVPSLSRPGSCSCPP
ncbi:MAG: DNA cytosine methyltransferase [Verrucomicrobia bacterium]|nr:DNA cytosine methyltransferase [Verrucomicrobiota bacterium]